MNKIYIIEPSATFQYSNSAKEFQNLFEKITGIKLEIITDTEYNYDCDAIIIGSDAVNKVAADLILELKVKNFDIRQGSDDYHIRSDEVDGKKLLFLSGGRIRSTYYAIYQYFEKVYNARYFWDGDILPKSSQYGIPDIDISESPRFEYRGMRYFAHRSLHRFQAEQWGFEDWKKEIDYILKKRLNMFMLRIGMDDLFQKAFPDIVDYPELSGKIDEAGEGFDDRSLFWSLQYRGELRKKLLEYAFERDLMHPEDCGTMTHWYSRTPMQFIEKIKPDMLSQTSNIYFEQTGLVWDIRKNENFQNYIKLTETHIKNYGKPDLFHTIGLAERRYYNDKQKNFELKKFVYKKLAEYISQNYPKATLLLASWDFYYTYSPDEVAELIKIFDPSRTIVLDYTSDSSLKNNFTDWGIVGKFPYIFGAFLGFESNSDIRSDYSLLEKRLETAANDSFCKGFVLWPELSHSDTFMLEYFAEAAWKPLEIKAEKYTEIFCQNRYESNTEYMLDIWRSFFIFIGGAAWCCNSYEKIKYELFFDIFTYGGKKLFDEAEKYTPMLEFAENNLKTALTVFEKLKNVDFNDEFIKRDSIDIARTLTGRYIHYYIIKIAFLLKSYSKSKNNKQKEIAEEAEKNCLNLLEELGDLLALHEDYSLFDSLEMLKTENEVNPDFENTLKQNSSNMYCRSYIYENVKYLYISELKLYFKWMNKKSENVEADAKFENALEMKKENYKNYMTLELSEINKIKIKELKSYSQIISNIKAKIEKY